MDDGSYTKIKPCEEEDREGWTSLSKEKRRYTITGHGKWGNAWDPVSLLHSNSDTNGSCKEIRRKFSGKDAEHPKHEDTISHFGAGLPSLKDWYRKRTLLAKATSKEVCPPQPKHLRGLVLSSWNHNGGGALTIFNFLKKRPYLSSPVISLKSLVIVHKLMQDGPSVCLSTCYARISFLKDIVSAASTSSTRSNESSELWNLNCAYASMLIEKVTFHHQFPSYENNYSVEFISATTKGLLDGILFSTAHAVVSLQKVQDRALNALQEGFMLLERKKTGENIQNMELKGAICNACSDPVGLIIAVLIPILREADLVYDICWQLLSSLMSSDPSSSPKNAYAASISIFKRQHNVLREMFEKARIEPGITCSVSPPSLPLDPFWVKDSLFVLEQQSWESHETSASWKALSLIDKHKLLFANNITRDSKSASGDDIYALRSFDPHEACCKASIHEEISDPINGGVGVATAVALRQFATGQSDAKDKFVKGRSMQTPPYDLKNARLKPPPNDMVFNLLVDVSASSRPQKPQHTRNAGRMWSSFDDAAYLDETSGSLSSTESPSPLQMKSPLLTSPRTQCLNAILDNEIGLGLCNQQMENCPDGKLSPQSKSSVAVHLKALQQVVVRFPKEASAMADTVALQQQQIEQMQQLLQEQQKQLQELKQLHCPQQGDDAQVNSSDSPDVLEDVETDVATKLSPQAEGTSVGILNSRPNIPDSWRFEGSLSDPTIWQDFSLSCFNENLTESSVADWEIPFSEIKLGQKIGQGAFGDVLRGTWQGTDVAVKCLQNVTDFNQASEDFRHEVAMIMRLRHPNIILFMGACTVPPDLYAGLLRLLRE